MEFGQQEAALPLWAVDERPRAVRVARGGGTLLPGLHPSVSAPQWAARTAGRRTQTSQDSAESQD